MQNNQSISVLSRLQKTFLDKSLEDFHRFLLQNTFLLTPVPDCFNCLPIAAIIEDKIFCCHGGLSPDLENMEQIRRIERPTDVPDSGLLCDLLWADPDKNVCGWAENERGVSFTFGADVVNKFLNKHEFGTKIPLNDFQIFF